MTQAPQAAVQAAPPPAAAAPAPPATVANPAASSRFSENVPQLLNRLQALAVAACLLFGLAATVVQVLSMQANGRAADNTEQVVRVQQIQSLLLRADAIATNSYLNDGLEPTEARAEYDDAIATTLRLITDAARAQPADRAVLSDLNTAVSRYTTAVAQARDYNRQQLPIGIAYLNSADAGLRADALPITQALVDTNSERAVDEMGGQHPVWLLGIGVLALVVLWFVNRQLARRFHRRVNVGIATSAVVVAALTVVCAAHASLKNGDNEDLRDGAYTAAVDEAKARTAANDAKAQESLGLVNRGSGSTVYEPKWEAQAAIVEANASPNTLALWGGYVAGHEVIRAADDSGDWPSAVQLATAIGEGTATDVLNRVDASAQDVIDSASAEAVDGFSKGGLLAVLLVVLTILGALAGAVTATRGIDLRRREYS